MPIWIRAPKGETEHYTGFTRAKLYELAAKGLIRSASIRAPGGTKGVRLFHLRSVLDFVERFEIAPTREAIPAPRSTAFEEKGGQANGPA